MKTWGVYDTKDKCWIGNGDDANAKGPLQFTSRMVGNQKLAGKFLAQAAALIIGEQMGTGNRFRYMAKVLPKPKTWRKKDEGKLQFTPAQAMRRLGV